MKTFHRANLGSLLAAAEAAALLAGLLAALATPFLTIDGARYLTVNGNPRAVLDCFAGSGTTLVAARGLRFHAIGIERDRSSLPALIRRVRQSVGLQVERAA